MRDSQRAGAADLRRHNPARLFVRGPTVNDSPHLGHAKTALNFDFIARYLCSRGLEVCYLQNIVDLDDKSALFDFLSPTTELEGEFMALIQQREPHRANRTTPMRTLCVIDSWPKASRSTIVRRVCAGAG